MGKTDQVMLAKAIEIQPSKSRSSAAKSQIYSIHVLPHEARWFTQNFSICTGYGINVCARPSEKWQAQQSELQLRCGPHQFDPVRHAIDPVDRDGRLMPTAWISCCWSCISALIHTPCVSHIREVMEGHAQVLGLEVMS